MMKKRIIEILRKLEYDVSDRRDDITFLVSVSFLISFFIANLWVALFEAEAPVGKGVNYSVGGNLVLGGFHIHHIAYGVLLITIAAWLSIKYKGDLLLRINAVLFGSGMGLILDELGFIIDGFRKSNDRIWFYGVCVGFAVIMAVSSFKQFYKCLKRSMNKE